MIRKTRFLLGFFLMILGGSVCAQHNSWLFPEHIGNKGMLEGNIDRKARYMPDGESFVIRNGGRLFNRSLYGGNSRFRVVGGDEPEFFLFDGGKDGVLRLGIINGENSKWLENADMVETRYTPGKLTYTIVDRLMGEGRLILTVLAGHDNNSLLMEYKAEGAIQGELVFVFGAASGKRFFRNGDLNTEENENVFLLNADDCKGDRYSMAGNSFLLTYKAKSNYKKISGNFPISNQTKLVDASKQTPFELWKSQKSETPAVASIYKLQADGPHYLSLEVLPDAEDSKFSKITSPKDAFGKAELDRAAIAIRLNVKTPDPYMNTLGGVWAIAADACWEQPTWLHGAIGWRVRLNGWRVDYLGDFTGWHDRSRMHFNAYFKSQIIKSEGDTIHPGEKENWAREAKDPKSMLYSSGYISSNPNGDIKLNHYDMNLVFIDGLLWHLRWTGDMDFVRQTWPVIQRHLSWEKHCFDPDNDGLYDAYCCIWASDALQYSGGSVTHSSSYNYRANKMAAYLAKRLGQNPKPYEEEAERIYNALQNKLWLRDKGTFAEFQDQMGNRIVHDSPALWTIYHAIDNQIGDPFQNYLMTRYVDTQIPHIPIISEGAKTDNYTLSTSNWQPYFWSINNVTFAEVAHTCLAYWQAGRAEEAYKLWRGNILDFMYLGTTPGNIGQISFYDAARGETYSDFSDPAGIGARALFEGMFGITPDALQGELLLKPGFPMEWDSASVSTPDFDFAFKRTDTLETYKLVQKIQTPLKLKLMARATKENIDSVWVNGQIASWKNAGNIGTPAIEIETKDVAPSYEVAIKWSGNKVAQVPSEQVVFTGERLCGKIEGADILEVYDPQRVISGQSVYGNSFETNCTSAKGHYTVFLKTKQGSLTWWLPFAFEVKDPLEVIPGNGTLSIKVKNNTENTIKGKMKVLLNRESSSVSVEIPAQQTSEPILLKPEYACAGTNLVEVEIESMRAKANLTDWNIFLSEKTEKVDISSHFNDSVTRIYQNQYLSPRPHQVTLQLPKHGYGNWCHYNDHPLIDDSGIRAKAGEKGEITLANQLSFFIPSKGKNIVFCSQWDNYPRQFTIPLQGSASHAYLLMTGSTNHMQSRIENGRVVVKYTDGSSSVLPLVNPDNWWSIEQDMHIDDYAFAMKSASPLRINLMTGEAYTVGKGCGTEKLIDGGMASVLDLPLNPGKELQSITVEAIANDIVIGLMAVSLMR